MRARCRTLAATALALAGVPAAWGGLSKPSEQGTEAGNPPPPPAPANANKAGSGESFEPETAPCVDLGNNCWRTRYADSNNNYGNNDQCTIPLPGPLPALLTVHRFATEWTFDNLFVDGVAYSGPAQNDLDGALVMFSLTWSTDGSITHSGWHICLAPTGRAPLPSGHGCPQAAACCFATDNRGAPDVHHGQPCIPSLPSQTFGSGHRCEPENWVNARPAERAKAGTCSSESPTAAPSAHPTSAPTSSPPTSAPTSSPPTAAPTRSPEPPTVSPTVRTASPSWPPFVPETRPCVDLGNHCWRSRYATRFILNPRAILRYGNNDYCDIPLPNVGSFLIIVHRFNTEPDRDALIVDGTRYSGTSGPHNVLVRRSLRWETNEHSTSTGWHICLEVPPNRRLLSSGSGCPSLPRSECCEARDGRVGTAHGYQRCFPARPGQGYPSNNECEPEDWIMINGHSSIMDDCSMQSLSDRYKLASGSACDSISDSAACCAAADTDGQDCMPQTGGSTECSSVAAGADGSSSVSEDADHRPTLAPIAIDWCPDYADPGGRHRLPINVGCPAIHDRAECCGKRDGRPGAWYREPCIPVADGQGYWNNPNLCEPAKWVIDNRRWGEADSCPDHAVPTYSPEVTPCVDLGNHCWRSRYANSLLTYGSNDRCDIPLPSGGPSRIIVHRFQTEAHWDKLIVDGVAYSGTGSPNLVLVHSTLRWETDGSLLWWGWHICLEVQTDAPSSYLPGFPSAPPTAFPTAYPSARPSVAPSTAAPSAAPTVVPSASPSAAPTGVPSASPTAAPTVVPSASPTAAPTEEPSARPTEAPTAYPSTLFPTGFPTQPPGGPMDTPRTCANGVTIAMVPLAMCDFLCQDEPSGVECNDYTDCKAPVEDWFTFQGVKYCELDDDNECGHESNHCTGDFDLFRLVSTAAPDVELPSAWPTRYPTYHPGSGRTDSPTDTAYPSTGYPSWSTVVTGFPTTGYPSTGFPSSGFPSSGFPSSGFPSSGFPSSGFPTRTGFPSRSPRQETPTDPVQLRSCNASSGTYTVDGVPRSTPCFFSGSARHVDYVDVFGSTARLYTCSKGSGHHFVLCTCSGATCASNEEPRNCYVPSNRKMGCGGTLRGAVFSGDGTKAFFACNKEVRVCRVDLSNRDGQWYSDCQVVEGAGCPSWAAIRGIAIRDRPSRGDLLAVVCTDWKTRACSLDTDNMRMQPERRCVHGGKRLCKGIGKPTAITFNPANRLIAACDSGGYTYAKFVGGKVSDPVHSAYSGVAPCPAETRAFVQLGSGRAVVACGPDPVRECLLQYS